MRLLRRGCYRDILQVLVLVFVLYFLHIGMERRQRENGIEETHEDYQKIHADIKNIAAAFDNVPNGNNGVVEEPGGNIAALNVEAALAGGNNAAEIDSNGNDVNVHVDPEEKEEAGNGLLVVEEKEKEAGNAEGGGAGEVVGEEPLIKEEKKDQKPVYIEKRDPLCKTTMLSKQIDPATIIVPFCDEPLEDLLDLLRSIKNNTKKELIYEIVYLRGKCKTAFPMLKIEVALEAEYDEVIVARAGDEVGTQQARRRAPIYTASDSLVFLEVGSRLTPRWLPPLLEILHLDDRTIAAPIVETLDPWSGTYTAPLNESMTVFDWHLRSRNMPLHHEAKMKLPLPFLSPLVPSSVFAISKEFYKKLGTHDPGIHSWGPAQLELSLKAWQCGGHIVVVPCSRVLLPQLSKGSPDLLGYRRVIEAWMSREYRRQIYKRRPDLKLIEPGDVSVIFNMKRELQCKGLDWYMAKVAKNVTKIFPIVPPPNLASGKITSMYHQDFCITSDGGERDKIFLEKCGQGQIQSWVIDWRNVLKTPDEFFCWTVRVGVGMEGAQPETPTLQECSVANRVPETQLWRYLEGSHQLQEGKSKRCLTLVSDSISLELEECDVENLEQKWKFNVINHDLISKHLFDF